MTFIGSSPKKTKITEVSCNELSPVTLGMGVQL